jgi:hypothetical protein
MSMKKTIYLSLEIVVNHLTSEITKFQSTPNEIILTDILMEFEINVDPWLIEIEKLQKHFIQ